MRLPTDYTPRFGNVASTTQPAAFMQAAKPIIESTIMADPFEIIRMDQQLANDDIDNGLAEMETKRCLRLSEMRPNGHLEGKNGGIEIRLFRHSAQR